MPLNVSPSIPTESSTAAPAGGFSTWFKNIGDWIKSLSPSGATQYDTDAITSGLTVTAGTNWTLNSYKLRRIGKLVEGEVAVTYGGNTITADSVGNIGDITAASVPSSWAPASGNRPADVERGGVQQWFGRITSSGNLAVANGLPGLSLSSGQMLVFRYTCMVA